MKLTSIFKTAGPIFVANLLFFVCSLLNFRIVGAAPKAYYLLALFLPFNYFLMALFESFRATYISLYRECAKSKAKQAEIATILLILLTAIFTLVGLVIGGFALEASTHTVFFIFTAAMLFVGILIAQNYLMSTHLYLHGKSHWAMMATVLINVLSVVITFRLFHHTMLGIYSLPLSLGIVNALGVLVLLGVLKCLGFSMFRWAWPDPVSFRLVRLFLKITTLPVWSSFMIIFVATLLFNSLLGYFGPAAVAGFGIAFRIQAIIILPAVALSMATGIALNHILAEGTHSDAQIETLMKQVLLSSVGIFLCLGVGVSFYANEIIHLFAPAPDVFANASAYLHYLGISYVGFGPLLMLLAIVEQTGLASKSLVINLLWFILEGVVAGCLAAIFHDVRVFYIVLMGFNFGALGLVLLQIYSTRLRLFPKYYRPLSMEQKA